MLPFFAVRDYSKAAYLFEHGKATKLEIRVRRVGRGGNECLADEDDTACPKRQPKHRESEINKQECMERSAIPAGLCKSRGSMVAVSVDMQGNVQSGNVHDTRKAPASCQRKAITKLEGAIAIHFRRQTWLWPARLSLETNGSWNPFVISLSTKMDARL